MMAAVAAPPAVAGATTTVTGSGTVPGNNLAIVFLASDPFVVFNPSMPFNFSAVAPGGAPPTASVEMGLAFACGWDDQPLISPPHAFTQTTPAASPSPSRAPRSHASFPNWPQAAFSPPARSPTNGTLTQRSARWSSPTTLFWNSNWPTSSRSTLSTPLPSRQWPLLPSAVAVAVAAVAVLPL